MFAIITIITSLITNGDCSNIVRRRVDYWVKAECTIAHPTCLIQFRRINTSTSPSCLTAQQIVPPNASVKSIFTQNHPILFHTKFKDFVFEMKSSINAWIKTEWYSQSACVVNIVINNATQDSLLVECDRKYNNFILIKIGSLPP